MMGNCEYLLVFGRWMWLFGCWCRVFWRNRTFIALLQHFGEHLHQIAGLFQHLVRQVQLLFQFGHTVVQRFVFLQRLVDSDASFFRQNTPIVFIHWLRFGGEVFCSDAFAFGRRLTGRGGELLTFRFENISAKDTVKSR
jgi:hypothetical protein